MVHVVRRFGICVHLCKSVVKDYRILSADWRRFSRIFFGVKSKLLNQPLLAGSKLRSEALWFTWSADLESVFICVNLWLKITGFYPQIGADFHRFFSA